jgi:hypothetical protein
MESRTPAAGTTSVTGTPRRKASLRRGAEHVLFGVGSGIASTVYGTVVIMATLTAAYATEKHPWKLAVIVLSTAAVLWIAHLYAHGLSESIVENRRLRSDEVLGIVRRELGILLAAALPTAMLVLGALGVFQETVAVWLALGVGLVTHAAEGFRFARMEHLRIPGTLVAVALNLALGGAVVALKVSVMH